MNTLVTLNYLIFAVTISLFLIELGAAILALVDFTEYRKRIIPYISPIWEISGTFSVFYLVNTVATYPDLVPKIGLLYLAPILLAAIFIIVRDALLAYSELIGGGSSRAYAKAYGGFTLATLFFVFSVLTSTVSGLGVNLNTSSPNFVYILTNPFNLLMFASIAFLVYAAAIVFFGLRKPKALIASILLSLSLLLLALHLYVPYLLRNLESNPLLALPTVLIFLGMAVMYLFKSRNTKFLIPPFLFVGILSFELAEYPMLFNSINITNYITPEPTGSYVMLFTIVGGAFLALALSIFVYVHHSGKRKHKAPGY